MDGFDRVERGVGEERGDDVNHPANALKKSSSSRLENRETMSGKWMGLNVEEIDSW